MPITADTAKPYFAPLLARVDELAATRDPGPLVLYLEAGHFTAGMAPDPFSLSSLEQALDLGEMLIKRHKEAVRLVYGLLADDLGLACGAATCSLTEAANAVPGDTAIPAQLEAALQRRSFLKRDRVLVFSERNAKNRAIDTLKRSLKKEVPCLETEARPDGEDIMLRRAGAPGILLCTRRDHRFAIKCPGIMGQHYADVLLALRERFFRASKFLLVDWSDLIDKTKVLQGIESARSLFIAPQGAGVSVAACNIFFADFEGETTEWHFANLAQG